MHSRDEIREEDIHGYTVSHNERAEDGADFLESLSHDAAEVFFEAARRNRHGAPFEDRHNRSYTLSHEERKNYHLERN